MQKKKLNLKKFFSFSFVLFAVGFCVIILGKSFEKSKFGQKNEKKLGIKTNDSMKTAQAGDCIEQAEKDDSALFVGCNGFF